MSDSTSGITSTSGYPTGVAISVSYSRVFRPAPLGDAIIDRASLAEENAKEGKKKVTCDKILYLYSSCLSLYYKIVLQKYLDLSHTYILKRVMARCECV